MTDFSKTLIRCSSLSCLFTEPKSKADKEAGKLSKTAQMHLIKTYIYNYWGIKKEIVTKQMEKGIHCEEDGLTLLSVVDGVFYEKNQDRMENDWVSGHADVVDEIIIDIKCSYEAETFLPKLIEEVDNNYFYQLQGYMWLWGKQRAKISYCLVSTPEFLREKEKYYLLRNMDVVTEESPEFLKAWEALEKTMIFDHIPAHERVIDVYVDRDEEIIRKIPEKVEKAREFLASFHDLHTKRANILVS